MKPKTDIGRLSNDDVARLMLAATERLVADDYDAAMVHLKSAISMMAVLKRQVARESKGLEQMTGAAGDVVSALVGLGGDPLEVRMRVKEAVKAGISGFEPLFRVASQSINRRAA